MSTKPLDRLKHHVTGAIERGEKQAITAVTDRESNARLIAAAPEMLEALRTIALWAESPGTLTTKGLQTMIEAYVKPAINKAKGN